MFGIKASTLTYNPGSRRIYITEYAITTRKQTESALGIYTGSYLPATIFEAAGISEMMGSQEQRSRFDITERERLPISEIDLRDIWREERDRSDQNHRTTW